MPRTLRTEHDALFPKVSYQTIQTLNQISKYLRSVCGGGVGPPTRNSYSEFWLNRFEYVISTCQFNLFSFYSYRDKETQESEPWVEKKAETKQRVRETPAQEVQKPAKKEKAPVASPKAAPAKAKPAMVAEPAPVAPEPQPVKAKAPVKSKPPQAKAAPPQVKATPPPEPAPVASEPAASADGMTAA